MTHGAFINDALVFLCAAVLVVPLLRHLKTSPVIGYLLAGVLIGPYTLGLVRDIQSAHTLAEFGVIFLLFTIGLELSLSRLREMRVLVLGLGTAQVLVTSLAIAAGSAAFLGTSVEASIVIGGALALSSTAFVMKILNDRGENATRHGRAAFAILLLQDFAVVPLLTLVPLLGKDETGIFAALGLAGLKALVVVSLIVVVGNLILRPVYRSVAATHSPELFSAMTLLVILGTGWVVEMAGFSMALGAFMAGLLLSETEYRHQIEADILPFKGILLGLFFMSIGMSIDTPLVMTRFGEVAGLLVGLLVVKAAILIALCRLFGLHRMAAVQVGPLLAQGGEFAFILLGIGVTEGVLTRDLSQVLLAVVGLSMVLTPLVDFLGRQMARKLDRRRKPRLVRIEDEVNEFANHVIIAGFGRVGQTVARVLQTSGVKFVALDLEEDRVYRCRHEGMPVFFGDASRLDVLQLAGASRAQAIVITLDQPKATAHVVDVMHSHFPELKIYVRAHDPSIIRDLEDLGATAVVPETTESSLQLGAVALRGLGRSTHEVAQVVDELRHDDYAVLATLVPSSPLGADTPEGTGSPAFVRALKSVWPFRRSAAE